jgi:hypothetical protein
MKTVAARRRRAARAGYRIEQLRYSMSSVGDESRRRRAE